MSGYGGTIEVVNLKPELSSSVKKELSKIMNLNVKDLEMFLDMLGFNFQIIFDWLKYQDKSKVGPFIRDEIQKKKDKITKLKKVNPDFFKEILQKDEMEKMDFGVAEEEFLKKNNIIITTANGSNGWHDRVVEKAVEELRNKK